MLLLRIGEGVFLLCKLCVEIGLSTMPPPPPPFPGLNEATDTKIVAAVMEAPTGI